MTITQTLHLVGCLLLVSFSSFSEVLCCFFVQSIFLSFCLTLFVSVQQICQLQRPYLKVVALCGRCPESSTSVLPGHQYQAPQGYPLCGLDVLSCCDCSAMARGALTGGTGPQHNWLRGLTVAAAGSLVLLALGGFVVLGEKNNLNTYLY